MVNPFFLVKLLVDDFAFSGFFSGFIFRNFDYLPVLSPHTMPDKTARPHKLISFFPHARKDPVF